MEPVGPAKKPKVRHVPTCATISLLAARLACALPGAFASGE
jgi:hypothetical protein